MREKHLPLYNGWWTLRKHIQTHNVSNGFFVALVSLLNVLNSSRGLAEVFCFKILRAGILSMFREIAQFTETTNTLTSPSETMWELNVHFSSRLHHCSALKVRID